MFKLTPSARVLNSRDLPPEFYSSQVDALFSDAKSLMIGAVAALVAVVIVGLRTGSVAIFAVAATLALLSAVRLWMMRNYQVSSRGTGALVKLERWERWYELGAASHVGLLGLFCLLTFLVTSDPSARMMSFATAIAYLAGIPGRNFASGSGVRLQLLAGGLPVLGAMAVGGVRYGLIGLVVLVPLFMALRGMAARLRGLFVQAVTKASDLSVLASRFDTALNNMPHGLAMFDRDGLVEVYNGRLAELLMLDPATDHRGKHMASLLVGAEPSSTSREKRLAEFQAQLSHPSSVALGLEMRNGALLEFTFQERWTGGAVVLVQDITERKRAEARISQLALYDDLTKLANRTHFRSILEQVLRRTDGHSDRFAVMFIDLDQFKQVNDTLGHSRGDMLICQVADRLRKVTAPADTIARFGGDEFVILHGGDGTQRSPGELASRIIAEISKPYCIDGHNVLVGASVGIALIPEHGANPEQLLKEADMALYCAKGDRRGSFQLFEPRMDVQARARSQLEFDLRHALRNDEFELYYQPIFNLKTGRFTVCEALLRWNHPTRGMVSPAEFIPVMEETNLIIEIGEWVLRQACQECAGWPDDLRVAVNVSSLQVRSGNLIPSVCQALAGARLPAQRLEVELTESVLLQDIVLSGKVMEQLEGLNVRISLDDFGTGYSSLSYLHTLPLNKVKIDRSFLAGLGTSEKTLLLLRGIARLSVELGLTVVVEGIETEQQLALVAAEPDLDEIQGYLFSRPLPARELARFLATLDARKLPAARAA